MISTESSFTCSQRKLTYSGKPNFTRPRNEKNQAGVTNKRKYLLFSVKSAGVKTAKHIYFSIFSKPFLKHDDGEIYRSSAASPFTYERKKVAKVSPIVSKPTLNNDASKSKGTTINSFFKKPSDASINDGKKPRLQERVVSRIQKKNPQHSATPINQWQNTGEL